MNTEPLIRDATTPEREAKRARMQEDVSDCELVLSPGPSGRQALEGGSDPWTPSRRLRRKTSAAETPQARVVALASAGSELREGLPTLPGRSGVASGDGAAGAVVHAVDTVERRHGAAAGTTCSCVS